MDLNDSTRTPALHTSLGSPARQTTTRCVFGSLALKLAWAALAVVAASACSSGEDTPGSAGSGGNSGTTGGAARNPIGELAQLVTGIYDAKTGRVKIPGFYDDVEPLSRRDAEDFRRSGFSIGGASRIRLDGCTAAGNGLAQVRTEGYSHTRIAGGMFDEASAPPLVIEGGEVTKE